MNQEDEPRECHEYAYACVCVCVCVCACEGGLMSLCEKIN